MKRSRTVTQVVALVLLQALSLAVLAPWSEAKKKDFQEGTILDAELASKTQYYQQTDSGNFPIGTIIREKKLIRLLKYTNDRGENRSALLHLDKSNYKDVTKTAEKETGIKAEKAD